MTSEFNVPIERRRPSHTTAIDKGDCIIDESPHPHGLRRYPNGSYLPDEIRNNPVLERAFGRWANALLEATYYSDPITHLPSGNRFKDKLEDLLDQRRENEKNKPCTVVFCDINHFKSINDKLGHEMADILIGAIGRKLRISTGHDDQKRQNFLARRTGKGDEFYILMKNKTRAQAIEEMRKITTDLAKQAFCFDKKTKEIIEKVTLAFGSYELDSDPPPDKQETIGNVLFKANQRMADHKAEMKLGRNADGTQATLPIYRVPDPNNPDDPGHNAIMLEDRRKFSDIVGLKDIGIFSQFVGEALAERKLPDSRPAAVVVLDMDGLRQVNDAYGHRAGDRVKDHLADFLIENQKKGDLIAHIGGGFFAMIMYDTGKFAAEQRMKTLADEFAKSSCRFEGKSISKTFSYGCCSIDPTDSVNEIMLNADKQLYENKGQKYAAKGKPAGDAESTRAIG